MVYIRIHRWFFFIMIDEKIKLLADDLYNFIKNKRNITRDPRIVYKFDDTNAKKILGKTGHYDPESEEIVVYCSNRHPKDILRSLAHEIIHHIQNIEGRMDPDEMDSAADENYILNSDFLRELELQAFGDGNLDIREWEAHMKQDKKDLSLNENLTPIVHQETVVVNDALKDSVVYQKDDRACNDLYNNREEAVFQDLMKKFGIKK